jgi:hypothetical protein
LQVPINCPNVQFIIRRLMLLKTTVGKYIKVVPLSTMQNGLHICASEEPTTLVPILTLVTLTID